MSSAGTTSNCSTLGKGFTICPRRDETQDANFQPRQHLGVLTQACVDVRTGDSTWDLEQLHTRGLGRQEVKKKKSQSQRNRNRLIDTGTILGGAQREGA